MATNFPSSLDSLTNPTSTDALNSPSHADQHADANDAIEALQAKVGVNGSAVTTSLDYKVENGVLPKLNVDSGVLVVDATNNRVGVNVSSPAHALDVVGRVEARAASTQDGVAIVGRAGGTSSFDVALTPTTLTADRTLTLPDASGTVALVGTAISLLDSRTFSSSTTYTIPTGGKFALVDIIGAGGGGGSGARNSGNGSSGGGAGGSGGARLRTFIPVTSGASVTVTVGAGGTGGASVTTGTNNGSTGGAGGVSQFDTLYAIGGRGGQAGSAAGSGGSATVGHLDIQLIASAVSGNGFGGGGFGGGTGLGTAGVRSRHAGGGGGGGGIGVSLPGNSGGAGGLQADDISTMLTVATNYNITTGGGGAAGAAGANGTSGTGYSGGGGGGSQTAANAGSGGNGGTGAGGGGGGGLTNGGPGTLLSGAGGTGGNAEIKVWVYG